MLYDWINETDEEDLLEKYNIRPGELRVKLELVCWLVYALIELVKVLNKTRFVNDLFKLRLRLNYGAKEELIPLLKLKGIGKHRARLLYSKEIKNLGDVKKAGFQKLRSIIGEKIAVKILSQLNVEVDENLLSKKGISVRKNNLKNKKNNEKVNFQSSLDDF